MHKQIQSIKEQYQAGSSNLMTRDFLTPLNQNYLNKNIYSKEGETIYHLWSEVYTGVSWKEQQKIVAKVHQKLIHCVVL
jgi:hypothetical protein